MQLNNIHVWDLSEAEALTLQQQMASRVVRQDRLNTVELVAGVDVAYDKFSNRLVAAAVIIDAQSLDTIESATAEDVIRFPYIPGLFSFRELPAIIKALEKINHTPDLIACDAQGIAHPRRFGLACHLGVLFDIPTIGCAKNLLIGTTTIPDCVRGASMPIMDKDEIIGSTLCTQDNVNPVYVSIGHRISLATACDWVLKLSTRYRLPETTRRADQLVRQLLISQ